MIIDDVYKSIEEGVGEFKTTVYPTLKTKKNFFTGKVENILEIDYKEVSKMLLEYGFCTIKLIRNNRNPEY